jgi:hypothetical protein
MDMQSVSAAALPENHGALGADRRHMHLRIVVTPGVAERPIVSALLHGLAPLTPAGAVKACDARDPASFSSEDGRARVVALIGSPTLQAAGALRINSDVAAALDEWRSGARQLLRAVQAAPHRFLCLDLAEAEAAPEALASKLGSWLQLQAHQEIVVLPPAATEPEQESLTSILARALVEADRTNTGLFGELSACCAVLVDGPAIAASHSVASEAVDEYRSLRERAHAAQAQQAAASDAAESERLRGELSAARQESEQLLLQLHQVQEELESYYLQLKEAEAATPTTLGPNLNPSRAEHLQETQRSDEPPHRHLQLRIGNLSALGATWPALDLRLVEHLGRPGLVLFTDAAGRRPLSAWQTSGREDEREFMLIVPSDGQGLRLLQPMGSADWELVMGLAARLQRHLQQAPRSGPWLTVATRLRRQLTDLPPRLRYDRLDAQRAKGESQALEVRFGATTFGALHLGELVLSWDPSRGSLLWQAPADVLQVPLSSWPVTGDGQLLPTLALPLDQSQPSAAKRAFWASLSETDRDLVLAVLDALPAVAERAADSTLPSPSGRDDLARMAAAWHKEARRGLSSLHVRRVARRLLRRVS